jgi:hypothetical protein
MAERKRDTVSWLTHKGFSPDFARAALDRFEAEQKRLRESKRHDRIWRAWQVVYSRDKDGGCDNTSIQRKGPQGEVLELRPNRFARILRDNLNAVRISPPNFEPQALNSSAKAQDQALVASGILDWYQRRLHLPAMRVRRVEYMQLAGEAVQHIWWDAQRGRAIGVGNSALDAEAAETESPAEEAQETAAVEADEAAAARPLVYEGDYVVSVRSPYDYALDPTSPDERKPRWSIVREPMDRYEAIALFVDKEQEAKIEGDATDYEDLRKAIMDAEPWSKRMTDWKFQEDEIEFDDSIAVYHVYGERSVTCPEGRHAIVLDAKHVLIDEAMVEDRAGVFAQRAQDVVFRIEPHSSVYDGLPVAEALGALSTTFISNADAWGMTRVVSPRKANVELVQLGTAFGNIEYDAIDPATGLPVQPPQPFNAPETPATLFTLDQLLKEELDMTMGGSAVQRGDPEATKGDSGSKTAMLYAASQTANSPLITSTLEIDAELATWTIGSLQKRATTKRITTIVGEKNTWIAREFTGADLEEISLVTVKPANPARDTFEGRMAMVEVLKEIDDPKKRDMIFALITTGQIKSEIEPDEEERMNIERENSLFLDPETPDNELPVINSYEQHLQHIAKHAAKLKDPAIKRDPVRTQRIMAHNQKHLDALVPDSGSFAGHEVLLATQQKAFPPRNPAPPGMGPQPGVSGPPPGAGKPAAGPGQTGPSRPASPTAGPGDGPEPPGRSGMPDMPKQPVNPASGERMNLPVPSAPNMGA